MKEAHRHQCEKWTQKVPMSASSVCSFVQSGISLGPLNQGLPLPRGQVPEAQFALHGKDYSIVFFDRLCFANFSFFTCEENVWDTSVHDHPALHSPSTRDLENCTTTL